MIEGFLLGVIFTLSLVAALFFFKFWRQTRDGLFLAFALAFLIEGLNRARFLALDSPSEGHPNIYLVRLLAFLLIVAAIVWKNRGRGG
jgi:hypothetical protein